MESPKYMESLDTEIHKSDEKPTRTHEELRRYNFIQMALIERLAEKQGLKAEYIAMDWVKNNSEVFNKLIELRPDLFERYEEDSQAVLEELERIMK